MRKFIAMALFTIVFFVLQCCPSNKKKGGEIFYAPNDLKEIQWSDAELKKGVAVKTLYKNEQNSHHVVLINTKERPHYHDAHDLTAFFIAGEGQIHFKNKTQKFKKGDTVFIPKGEFHWTEKTSKEALKVYVLFNPPFDGKDRRFADK